jgi:cytoskeletal protein RodZ
MNRQRNALYLALLSALFLFAWTLSLHAAAAQQSTDQSDSSSTKKSSKSKQAPAAAPTTTPASTTPAASTPAAKPAATQQTPSAKSNLMVWVNTDSGVYHKPGTRFYGKTKQGKYMSEADAIKAGYRPAAKN